MLGELLFRIVGITAKADDVDEDEKEEDEDKLTAESSRKALLEVLGQDRRDRVLAAVYIVRQDPSGVVRQLSIHVWKALVHNTPRTLREILPVLSTWTTMPSRALLTMPVVNILVRTLSSPGSEQRDVRQLLSTLD